MSNLMKLVGTVLALGGVALGAMTFVTPGRMDVYGIKLDTAAIMFVGGVLALGLAGVIDALRSGAAPAVSHKVVETVAEVQTPTTPTSVAAKEAVASIGTFSRKTTEATVAASAATAAVAASAAAIAAKPAKSDPVADTISALEQAKADVIKSMGGMESLSAPPPEPSHLTSFQAKPAALQPTATAHLTPPVAHAPAVEEEAAEEDLYVTEEKVIRGRPARILSDDTVEAETDEGWMRFENVEHLNEYLDSVEEQNA